MKALARALGGSSGPLRCGVVGAVVLGVLGGAVGLVVGLRTYAPTAWAATVEVGLPAAVAGAVLGGLFGWLTQRARSSSDGA